MKSEEEALNNVVTNADIAQNAAIAEVKVLVAEMTEAETTVEIKRVSLGCVT